MRTYGRVKYIFSLFKHINF